MENTMGKRVIAAEKKQGVSAADMLLVGVLLAAGAVLKFFVGSLFSAGMKPNFIIAMYCLAILLIKPRMREALVIGLLAGAVSQFFPGTPYINFVSELLGAFSMCLLCRLPLKFGKLSFTAIVTAFLGTLVSGFSFIGVMYLVFYAGVDIVPTPLGVFLGIIFGTAFINTVIVQLLYSPLKRALKKD